MEAARILPESIRVLIADDHRLFAETLEALLATDERVAVAGYVTKDRIAAELIDAIVEVFNR